MNQTLSKGDALSDQTARLQLTAEQLKMSEAAMRTFADGVFEARGGPRDGPFMMELQMWQLEPEFKIGLWQKVINLKPGMEVAAAAEAYIFDATSTRCDEYCKQWPMSLQYATSLLEVLPQRLQPLVAMRDIIKGVITVEHIQTDADFELGGYSNRPLQHFVDMTVGCAAKKWVEAKVGELLVAERNPWLNAIRCNPWLNAVADTGGSADRGSSSSGSEESEESEWEEVSEPEQEEAAEEEGGGEAEGYEDGSEGEEDDDDEDEDDDDGDEGGKGAQLDYGAEEEQDGENA